MSEKMHFLHPVHPDRNFPLCGDKEWRTLSNRMEDVTCGKCKDDWEHARLFATRAEIDKLIAEAHRSPAAHFVPMPGGRSFYDEHNFEHDMAKGPCACGATH